MRTINIIKNVYSFDDVIKNRELKEKVLDKYRNIETDYFILTAGEDILEVNKEKLRQLGYSNVSINYTGFWSQGDGASFTGDITITKELLERLDIVCRPMMLDIVCNNISFVIKRHDHRYYHENTVHLVDTLYNTLNKRIDNQLNSIRDSLFTAIKKEMKNISLEIYKELKDAYDFLERDETILESLCENGWEFNEDGTIYSEAL